MPAGSLSCPPVGEREGRSGELQVRCLCFYSNQKPCIPVTAWQGHLVGIIFETLGTSMVLEVLVKVELSAFPLFQPQRQTFEPFFCCFGDQPYDWVLCSWAELSYPHPHPKVGTHCLAMQLRRYLPMGRRAEGRPSQSREDPDAWVGLREGCNRRAPTDECLFLRALKE